MIKLVDNINKTKYLTNIYVRSGNVNIQEYYAFFFAAGIN